MRPSARPPPAAGRGLRLASDRISLAFWTWPSLPDCTTCITAVTRPKPRVRSSANGSASAPHLPGCGGVRAALGRLGLPGVREVEDSLSVDLLAAHEAPRPRGAGVSGRRSPGSGRHMPPLRSESSWMTWYPCIGPSPSRVRMACTDVSPARSGDLARRGPKALPRTSTRSAGAAPGPEGAPAPMSVPVLPVAMLAPGGHHRPPCSPWRPAARRILAHPTPPSVPSPSPFRSRITIVHDIS